MRKLYFLITCLILLITSCEEEKILSDKDILTSSKWILFSDRSVYGETIQFTNDLLLHIESRGPLDPSNPWQTESVTKAQLNGTYSFMENQITVESASIKFHDSAETDSTLFSSPTSLIPPLYGFDLVGRFTGDNEVVKDIKSRGKEDFEQIGTTISDISIDTLTIIINNQFFELIVDK